MANCKHQNADHVRAGEQYGIYDRERGVTTYHEAIVEQFRCCDCGAWLSLGRSNDRPAAVQIEIHAVELVRDRRWHTRETREGRTDAIAEEGWLHMWPTWIPSKYSRGYLAGWLSWHMTKPSKEISNG